MGIKQKSSLLHWNYFIALEADIESLSRYVEFTKDNFKTYSIEIAHILLASSSEVDVVAKQFCKRLDAKSKASQIDQYREVITSAIPEFADSLISLPRYGLELSPWSNWNNNQSPLWWKSHNEVKHQRNEHFPKANIKNVLNSMAGLFILILYFYKDIIDGRRIEPPPSIFTPPSDLAYVCPSINGRMALFYTE